MADTVGQADIRGIDIDKVAKGFAEEAIILRNFCNVQTTSAREIRWYQKTSGFLDSSDTTAITATQLQTSQRSVPHIVKQTWTRNTSYVKKWFAESETISMEDIKDNDVDIFSTHLRDIVRAVSKQVDVRIYNVLTESLSPSNINTTAATGTGWDDATTGDPILDIMVGNQKIRTAGYNTDEIIMYINPIEHKNLMQFLISVKGSSIPAFSSERIKDGVVMEVLGNTVVVSENATTDYALQFVRNTACTWKSFMPLTTAVVDDPGIGKKIRVWEEGEALLTDPLAVHLVTDTVTG